MVSNEALSFCKNYELTSKLLPIQGNHLFCLHYTTNNTVVYTK